MPALPGGAVLLDAGEDAAGSVLEPGLVEPGPGRLSRVKRPVDHRLDGEVVAKHVKGLVAPGGALLGQGSRFVLGLARLQRRLLGEHDRLDRRRRTPVAALEVAGQFGLPGDDAVPTGRPSRQESGLDADDLADGTLARIVAGAGGELDAERLAEVGLEGGVVGLGRGGDGLVHQAAVDGEPASVGDGLDLVGDGDVGVQVGVAGAGVAVGEGGADQASDLDLTDAVGAGACEQDLLLDEGQGVVDGGLMGGLDDGGELRVGQCPQR